MAEQDPVKVFYEQYVKPGIRPPMSYWTDKGNGPPPSYASEYRSWLMQNTENIPRRERER